MTPSSHKKYMRVMGFVDVFLGAFLLGQGHIHYNDQVGQLVLIVFGAIMVLAGVIALTNSINN